MIPANEYRVNNWVETWQGSKRVTLIMLKDIATGGWPENEGIPLTESLLKRCGFVKLPERSTLFVNGRVQVCLLGKGSAIASLLSKDAPKALIPGPCRYLHQLQNIYFAITGEELPVSISL